MISFSEYASAFSIWQWAYLFILLAIGISALFLLRHWRKAGKKLGLWHIFIVVVLILPAMAQNCSPIYPGYVGIPLIDAPVAINFLNDTPGILISEQHPIILDPIRVETANQMMLSVEGNLLWNATGNHTDLLNGSELLEAGHMAFWNETNA